MNLDLKNKRALVCGSTQGIGKAVAIELALLGANVTLVARNEQSLKQTKSELHNNGSQLHSYLCVDFNDAQALKELVEQFFPKVSVTRELGENEALFSNRKIREVLGFKEQHNWQKYVKMD